MKKRNDLSWYFFLFSAGVGIGVLIILCGGGCATTSEFPIVEHLHIVR